MWGEKYSKDKNIEKTVREILKSRARSRIYTYLLKNNGARSDEIIKGTKLHPSTVREK
jgi:predicted transcriptional regulator